MVYVREKWDGLIASRRDALAMMAGAIATLATDAQAQINDAAGWHIIVWAGESEGVYSGRGDFNRIASLAGAPRCFQIGRAPYHPDMTIVPLTEPPDFWINLPTAHGSAYSACLFYIEHGYLPAGYNLLLIPCACPGSSILQWNGVFAGKGQPLWPDMLARIDLALATLPNASLQMFKWHQIANDIIIACRTSWWMHDMMKSADQYVEQELALHANFRARYGTVPIVRANVPDGWLVTGPSAAVKASFLAAAATMPGLVSQYAITDTSGLGSNYVTTGLFSGKLHFDANAHEFIAQRDIYQSLAAIKGA